MNIAQVAPLYESIPPKMYGGTERIVHYLTEELLNFGHQVTLFASGDSQTNAKLIPVCKKALRLDPECIDPFAHHIAELQMVQDRIQDFDIIHYHTDYFHYPLSIRSDKPHITTLHGRLDIKDLQGLYGIFNNIPLISISHSQRIPLPVVNWIDNIYHGLPRGSYHYKPGPGEYLAFIGRISPEKGVDRAIMIAKETGIKLKIAAKVSKVDEHYFQTEIRHLLDDPLIDFIGEIEEKDKCSFFGNAIALLFPINWPEPFGIVMIEAMACGTPVIAYNMGSVPEIIENGKTGFIINSIDEGIKAVNSIHLIERKKCREIFETRFTSRRMTEDYLKIYDLAIAKKSNVDQIVA